jgi:sulfonate transport system permease protein
MSNVATEPVPRTGTVSLTPPAAEPSAAVTPDPRPADRPRTGGRHRSWSRLVSPILVLAAWQGLSGAGVVASSKLPSPITLGRTAGNLISHASPAYGGTLQSALLVSLERVALGFALGAAAGISLAIVAGSSRLGEVAVDPIAQALRTLPLFGLIPVFIVWFGIGQTPKIALIALATLFPLYLNTLAGIQSLDRRNRELATVLGLRRREVLRHVVLPGALPGVLVGLRQSLGLAWLALVVAEQINASAGLGYVMNQAEQFLQINVILVVLLVYCVLGLLTDSAVRAVERRALTWHGSFAAR